MLVYILLAAQLLMVQGTDPATGKAWAVGSHFRKMPNNTGVSKPSSTPIFKPPPSTALSNHYKPISFQMGDWKFRGKSEPEPPKPVPRFAAMKFNFGASKGPEPAAKPETKAEPKSESKSETKPEAKPETKPEANENVLPADAPGAAILGDRLKGLYVPREMLVEIGKELAVNEADDKELPGNGVFSWSRTAVQVAECGDPKVDVKAINKILREVVGLEHIDAPDKPWAPDDRQVLDLCKDLHDKYRAKHYAHPLYFDERINDIARFHANELAAVISCCGWKGFYHSQYGLWENVFVKQTVKTGISGEDILKEAVDRWYKEGENFKEYGKPTVAHNLTKPTGHFTGMIWRDSQYFGLGLSKATKDNVTTYVCVVLYDPPGNLQNLFTTNVLEPGKYEGKSPPQIEKSQDRFVERAFVRLLRDVDEKRKYIAASKNGTVSGEGKPQAGGLVSLTDAKNGIAAAGLATVAKA